MSEFAQKIQFVAGMLRMCKVKVIYLAPRNINIPCMGRRKRAQMKYRTRI